MLNDSLCDCGVVFGVTGRGDEKNVGLAGSSDMIGDEI